ncbi:hypothetical protein J057_01750 [Marinobacter nanhaiticus D15-8W]|uniref:ATP-grasp domain-containing protein n=1 Tax=Marinobacter nanhaiticus D15-8W TaxID=626887 RepID=N6X6X9_9GAMM|nr:ATP-grasp fold amidoligase family protein [Marinobacter nanhaiticus]ENO16888.1 hypothetical protein J057_01750 [Marinobacter nanhaiticus D15-8W]
MKKQIAGGKLDKPVRLVKRLLPKNRWGDYMTSLLTFVLYQGRLPKREGGDLNDALFALKTSDEILNPLRVFVSDKHHLKQFVKATAGDEYNVPTDAVLQSLEAAMEYDYPADCVIKPTHMSGEVMFRREGSPVDFKRMARWFDSNYYNWTREANYRPLKPKVIVEPYIFGGESCEDYKIFCVNGEPKMIWVDLDRQGAPRRNFYTTDWELLPVSMVYRQGKDIPKPANLTEMLDVARQLSRDFSMIRVDLYSNGEKLLVGELTNCSEDARGRVVPVENAPIVTNLLFGKAGLS